MMFGDMNMILSILCSICNLNSPSLTLIEKLLLNLEENVIKEIIVFIRRNIWVFVVSPMTASPFFNRKYFENIKYTREIWSYHGENNNIEWIRLLLFQKQLCTWANVGPTAYPCFRPLILACFYCDKMTHNFFFEWASSDEIQQQLLVILYKRKMLWCKNIRIRFIRVRLLWHEINYFLFPLSI